MFFGNYGIVIRFNAFFNDLGLKFLAVTSQFLSAHFHAPFRHFVLPDYEQKVSTLYTGLESVF